MVERNIVRGIWDVMDGKVGWIGPKKNPSGFLLFLTHFSNCFSSSLVQSIIRQSLCPALHAGHCEHKREPNNKNVTF